MPFDGDDMTDTLADVLKREPDWAALPPDVPPAIRTLLQSCLVKDRAKSDLRRRRGTVRSRIIRPESGADCDISAAPRRKVRSGGAWPGWPLR